MYGCKSWTIKKSEHRRTDGFELWCWRRLLTWTARRSNQSILKEVSPEYSLEGLMLKLKLQYFGHLMWRTDSLEKTLMPGEAGGEGDNRGWDGWMASLTRWTWFWARSGRWWRAGKPGVAKSRTPLSSWTVFSRRCTHTQVPAFQFLLPRDGNFTHLLLHLLFCPFVQKDEFPFQEQSVPPWLLPWHLPSPQEPCSLDHFSP